MIMHSSQLKQKSEKSALKISLTGSTVFVGLELLMAIYTSSQAVLLDAVYDGVELLMIFVSLSLVPLLYKPSNESRPFGYLQIESLFVVVRGAIMVAVTVGLIVNNIQIILHGGRHVNFSAVAYFELAATVIRLYRHSSFKAYERRSHFAYRHYGDSGMEDRRGGILRNVCRFLSPSAHQAEWFVPLTKYLDQAIAIILSIFMLPVPVRAVTTGLRDLFLLPPEEETVQNIKDIITPILDAYGYDKLYFDIVRTGRKLWISVYITFDRDEVSISRFRIVQKFIIQALSKEYQDFYFELLPDIEYNDETEV
ncbi:MAG: cation transporter [[Clostridium] scindens]